MTTLSLQCKIIFQEPYYKKLGAFRDYLTWQYILRCKRAIKSSNKCFRWYRYSLRQNRYFFYGVPFLPFYAQNSEFVKRCGSAFRMGLRY